MMVVTQRQLWLSHAGMFGVAVTFGGYNILAGRTTAFPDSVSQIDRICRQTVFLAYRQLGGALILVVAACVWQGTWRALPWMQSRRDWALLFAQGFTGIYASTPRSCCSCWGFRSADRRL